MLYKRSCSTKGATQCLGLTFKYHLWLTEPWSKTKPSVYHPYFASLINESISWLYCNFCWEFSCYFYTRLSDFLSNTCWLHVVVLILRVNLQKKVCFFFKIFRCTRGIYFFTMKRFLVKILFVSVLYQFEWFFYINSLSNFPFLCFQESSSYSSVQFTA